MVLKPPVPIERSWISRFVAPAGWYGTALRPCPRYGTTHSVRFRSRDDRPLRSPRVGLHTVMVRALHGNPDCPSACARNRRTSSLVMGKEAILQLLWRSSQPRPMTLSESAGSTTASIDNVLEPTMSDSLNVFGEPLQICSMNPRTGFLRNGCCDTGPQDVGSHTVCAVMTEEFLEFSRSRGNDLSTPMPAFGFPGLRAGDRWCLCAARWQEAFEAGRAPRVALQSTHKDALDIVALKDLKAHAIDLA